MTKYPYTCLAISGLFLRENSWSQVKPYFKEFYCIDHLRDEQSISMMYYLEIAKKKVYNSKYPVIIFSHSYGSSIALELSSICKDKIISIVFINGLLPKVDQSAIETYTISGQNLLLNLVKLNFETGLIYLNDVNQFKKFIGYKDLHIPSIKIANNESCEMIMHTFKYCLKTVNNLELFYFIAKDDLLTSEKTQLDFSSIVNCKLVCYEGSHMKFLLDPIKLIKSVFSNLNLNCQ